MAQVDSANNPNDPNNPNSPLTAPDQNQQGDNQPATSGGGGAVTSTGAGNVTGQVAGTANPAQPFQNISSYLAANQPQSQKLAQQVAGTVSAPIDEAGKGITDAANSFSQSVNAGYTPENKELTTAVSNNPNYVVNQNPDNVTNFLAQLNNRYQGPTDFSTAPGYSDLQTKIATAQGKAASTQTPEGVQSLLKDVEGPTTAGINKFDSILLNQNPDNLKTVRDAGAGAANLLPTLNQTTTDQNKLAAEGATNASTSAANALSALNTARTNVGTNLSNEQKTIEGVVNDYNKSVGIINPVVSSITSAISDFLANNPNIKFDGANPMADLENIASIVMPEMATYASPEDYAQIAALMQLGDTNVGNLPISSATSGQAQSFKIPTQLMDALGKAPGVQKALQQELSGFGNQINDAVAPFTQAEKAAYDWNVYGMPAQKEVQDTQKQLAKAQTDLAAMEADNKYSGNFGPQMDALRAQIPQLQQKLEAANATLSKYPMASWDSVGPIAQGLQWVNGTQDAYQGLIDMINEQLGKLGNVGMPSLTYGPSAMAAPSTGAPIGVDQASKLAATGTQIGAPIAAGLGGGAAAANAVEAANVAAGGFGEGLATSGAEGAEMAAQNAAGLQSGLSAVAPAAIAAYGASNIVKNASANPIKAGLGTLGNMGISLATLSLPPQIFKSIGKEISSVVKSIGDFFGGLF